MSQDRYIDRFFDFINTRELGKLEELLTDAAEFYFPKTQPLFGRKQIIRFSKILFRRYPEVGPWSGHANRLKCFQKS